MSEELLQRNLIKNPEKIGSWDFYNIGATSINALKEANIIRSIDYGNVGRKKVDGIITKQKEIIAIVEYKHPKQFNTNAKKNNAILQEIEVAKKLKTKLIIATDTYETLWVNVATGNSVQDINGNELKYIFNPKDLNLQKVIIDIIQSISEKNDRILPKELIDPTSLAKQIWQDVWSVSGATPENCLYTFVELFIFKYLSDLNILRGNFSFSELLKKYDTNEVNDVLQHYANVVRPKIKDLFPEGEDKTTIINGTIFVSKDQKAVDGYGTVFKKVLEKFRDYGKLEHIDHDFKSKLFESFLKESISKKNWGQFFTPIKVVRAINEMAHSELKEGMSICDPACGVGKFPLEFVKENLEKLFEVQNGKITQKVKIIGFDKGFDKDEQKTIILAKANMLIYFCELVKENPEYTKQFANLFNESFILKTNSILGTLSEPIENEYDLILTNPPYVTSGSSNLKEEIAKSSALKNYYKINAMGIEGLFMEWIIRALKPTGKAFIVVPDGIFNRQNDKNLRQFILDNCFIEAIISLPIKTFFTTPKKTYILSITKKDNTSQIQTDPVFTYLCSEIGESRDIYRFDIEQDDLKEAINLFNAFKGNKQYFATLNHDKRCKLHTIDKFKPEDNWSVENFFTEEEKIGLGVSDLESKLSMIDFASVLEQTTNTILSFQDEIKNIAVDGDSEYLSVSIGEIFDLS
jgi:type I restriction-modification system DNA methylase subunit